MRKNKRQRIKRIKRIMTLEEAGVESTNPCGYKDMQKLLLNIQTLQRKAAGKVDMWITVPRSSGAMFGGIVSEIDICINVTLMDVFDDPNQGKDNAYHKDFDFYNFDTLKVNAAKYAELKDEVDRIVRNYDKEYKRRLKNMVKRNQRGEYLL